MYVVRESSHFVIDIWKRRNTVSIVVVVCAVCTDAQRVTALPVSAVSHRPTSYINPSIHPSIHGGNKQRNITIRKIVVTVCHPNVAVLLLLRILPTHHREPPPVEWIATWRMTTTPQWMFLRLVHPVLT